MIGFSFNFENKWQRFLNKTTIIIIMIRKSISTKKIKDYKIDFIAIKDCFSWATLVNLSTLLKYMFSLIRKTIGCSLSRGKN